MSENNKTKKKLSLSTIIFIALLTGAVFGILIHYFIPEGIFAIPFLSMVFSMSSEMASSV